MSSLVAFLLGIALYWVWNRTRNPVPAEPAAPALTVADEPANEAAPSVSELAGTPADGDLSPDAVPSRIEELAAAAEAEANAASHPRDLLSKPNFARIRDLLVRKTTPLDLVRDYAIGSNWVLSVAAVAAIPEREDRDEAVAFVKTFFDTLPPWAMYFALKLYLAASPRPPVGLALTATREWWKDNMYLVRLFREHFEERDALGDPAAVSSELDGVAPENSEHIKAFLSRIGHPYANALASSLESQRARRLDRTFLATIGKFWQARENEILVEPEEWAPVLDASEAGFGNVQVRSLLATGEPRAGKTSFLRLLARRIEQQGWTVFEAGGADLMAGQQWFGQLEARIQRLADELSVSKKVIWYIPDMVQLAMSGTHQGQSASILDQILPAISAGRLVVWTETPASGLARLVRLRPGLRGTFDVIALEPMAAEETIALGQKYAAGVLKSSGIEAGDDTVSACVSTARQYLTASGLPGAALDLLRLSFARAAKEKAKRVEPHDVVETLAQLTGLPASILDSRERVDLGAVRRYFSERVIGQEEAVEALVERIAMLKAGLNDPSKPIGVFLFAGPTGTGKTEIAKTVAEFLFGSQDRLIRLDMSEFQTAESTVKILGSGDAAMPADSLITFVRKQPFSVILLDEFEKAHSNIWDLFLQVFDDGRLTDQMGQVADFRHCIIILTSNLGATSHRTSRLGFAPGADAYSNDQVLRAVSQTFRPEFQNRLDKIIVFKPLSREVMRGILQKELSLLLQRRGLKDREWAVEWEGSALEFLLEKGFSPEMGARPLKRAIDQYLIAPLAATIVEKRFPEGDQFVFVRSDGRAIQAEFVDPDADAQATTAIAVEGDVRALPGMILAPQGIEEERAALAAESRRLEEELGSNVWEERKNALNAKMQESGFWGRDERFSILSRLALIDRVRAAAETAASLKVRLDKISEASGKSSRELISRLALQLHLVGEGIKDVEDGAPIEVALLVESALYDSNSTENWCEKVREMYAAWCRNRNMQVSDIDLPVHGAKHNIPALLITGFGAARTLAREAGLHVLETSGQDGDPARAAARVRLLPVPLGDLSGPRLKLLLADGFDNVAVANNVVRRYRTGPAPLVRDLRQGWRSGRFASVLAGNFDLIGATKA